MAAANNSLNGKVRNLPLLCVETICKFTPTSKLIRLCSIAIPLPGAWSLGLEAVLKKRLPLSLGDDYFPYRLHGKALFDISGAKVASIKKPEAFRFSPIREFIERAVLPVEVASPSSTDGPLQFHIVYGDALLSHLSNVIHLELVVHDTEGHCQSKDVLEPCLKHLLPQLQAFFISYQFYRGEDQRRLINRAFGDFVAALRIDEMTCLRRLALPVTGFDCLMRAAADRASGMQSVLAGLSSLAIEHKVYYHYYDTFDIGSADYSPFLPALNFVALSCKQLSQLKVEVRGEFSAYLAAFRQLPLLTSLALDVCEPHLTGLTFDGRDAIDLVSHLRIIYQPFHYTSQPTVNCLLKIATFFPSVTAVDVMTHFQPNPLAAAFFGQRQIFPAAAKLSCFHIKGFSCTSGGLAQFLANPRLPEAVDLSAILFENMARDAGLLADVYCVMQSNSIKSLLLSGPVHREALPRLQGHIELNGESSTKISAWKDRDFGEQPGIYLFTEISEQTDFKILGKKTSGNLKDEEFTIRVFHQLAKRGTGSWYFVMK